MELVPIRTLLILLAATVTIARSASEITVQPDPTGAPVIAAAIDAAAPGIVIRLATGVYREYVTISKSVAFAGAEGASG